MLLLILLTFLVFISFWLGDFYLTLKTAKRIGVEVELNPLMRLFLRFRGRYIWILKLGELILFFYLIYYLTSFDNLIPFYTLLGYVVLYGLLVANNSKIYYEVTGEQSPVILYLFVGVTIFIALFIYLNYVLYSDLTNSYNILISCKSSFNTLYQVCQQNNTAVKPILPPDLENVLKSLNFTINPW